MLQPNNVANDFHKDTIATLTPQRMFILKQSIST